MKTVQFMNHSHPAVQAAEITSEAMSKVYFAMRSLQCSRSRKKDRDAATRAMVLTERVHMRVSDILRNTPSAWITKEIAA